MLTINNYVYTERLKGVNVSKIGKTPIQIQAGTTVALDGRVVTVQGPKGTLKFQLPSPVDIKIEGEKVVVSLKKNEEDNRALFGLTRAKIANILEGVTRGFEKKLELIGVGYRAQVSGSELVLSVGFSHPVRFVPDNIVSFAVSDNIITVSGIDKELVGNTAAKIRAVRPPEPYKGKGIRYVGEQIRRKAGKAAKAVGAK